MAVRVVDVSGVEEDDTKAAARSRRHGAVRTRGLGRSESAFLEMPILFITTQA